MAVDTLVHTDAFGDVCHRYVSPFAVVAPIKLKLMVEAEQMEDELA